MCDSLLVLPVIFQERDKAQVIHFERCPVEGNKKKKEKVVASVLNKPKSIDVPDLYPYSLSLLTFHFSSIFLPFNLIRGHYI